MGSMLRLVVVELSRHTTLGLGGPARAVLEPDSAEAVAQAIESTDGPQLILGGGSNLVVADEGFAGTVIKLGEKFSNVSVERSNGGALVVAEAGAWFDDLVARTVGDKLQGLEALSGIPGSVGATPMQNVGAYGREIAEVLQWVEAYDRVEECSVQLSSKACQFGYRTSRFRNSNRYVILRVALRLDASEDSMPIRYAELARVLGVEEGKAAPIRRVREAVLELRRSKGMVIDAADADTRSAGSFFTNPIVPIAVADEVEARAQALGFAGPMPRFPAAEGHVKLAAAWLLERAGFGKGYGEGAVGVSSKHALALINRGGGTTAELLALARTLRAGVLERFGVTLAPEPVLVGCEL